MTRYTPDADRMAIRRIRRVEAKSTPKARTSGKLAAIAESMGV